MFAGQRNDGFFVDLGSIFDLGDLRPFQNLHLIPSPAATSVDTLSTLNVHTIAIQVPITHLTRDGSRPTDPSRAKAVLGIWGAASRRRVKVTDTANDAHGESGPWVQVSRLGNPLFNEVIVPLGKKDRWNGDAPRRRQGLRAVRRSTRSWRGCCRCSTRGCSRTSPASRRSGPISSRSS